MKRNLPWAFAVVLVAGACTSGGDGTSDDGSDAAGGDGLDEFCSLVTETAPGDGPPETPEDYEAWFTWGLDNTRAKAEAAPAEIAEDYQASLAEYEAFVAAVRDNGWSPDGVDGTIADQALADRILDFEVQSCGVEDPRVDG